MNSKTLKSFKKSKTSKTSKTLKTLNLNKIKTINEKKLYKYNKIITNKKDEDKIKTKKIFKNKTGGASITDLQSEYSSDDYQEAGMFDFMKIKTNALGGSSSSNPPEMPACCIS